MNTLHAFKARLYLVPPSYIIILELAFPLQLLAAHLYRNFGCMTVDFWDFGAYFLKFLLALAVDLGLLHYVIWVTASRTREQPYSRRV